MSSSFQPRRIRRSPAGGRRYSSAHSRRVPSAARSSASLAGQTWWRAWRTTTGARPAPGVTVTYNITATGTFIDAGAPQSFTNFVGAASWTEPQPPAPPGVPPGFNPPSIDSTPGGGGAPPTGSAGQPIGIFLVFTEAQVQAMDSLPSCQAAQVSNCTEDMRTAGVIDSTISWPKWACGVYAGYDSTGWAAFRSVAGPDSAWRTHDCDRELVAMGYPNAAVTLDAVVDSIAAGVFLATLGPIMRWFAQRL